MEPIAQGLSSAYRVAHSGIQRGASRMQGASEKLTQEIDVEAIVDLKMGEAQVRASVATVRAVDEAMGALLDIVA